MDTSKRKKMLTSLAKIMSKKPKNEVVTLFVPDVETKALIENKYGNMVIVKLDKR